MIPHGSGDDAVALQLPLGPMVVINKKSNSQLTVTNWKAVNLEIRVKGHSLYVTGLLNHNKHLQQKHHKRK